MWPLKLWSFCMIKRYRGLVAIIQMQNDPFFDSLWPFYMIKINLALINLVILHLYRTKRTMQKTDQTMQKTMQTYRAITFTKNKANDAIRRPRAWFPFGPNNNFFFMKSVVGEQPSTTNRIASRGSPHDPTMRSRPCDPTAQSLHIASPPSSF